MQCQVTAAGTLQAVNSGEHKLTGTEVQPASEALMLHFYSSDALAD